MKMTDIFKDPVNLQEQNLHTVIKELKETYDVVERLVHKTYLKNEMEANSALRNIRTDISRLLTDIKCKHLNAFCAKQGKLEDLYAAEESFVQDSATLLEYAGSLIISQDPVDVPMLEGYLRQLEKTLNKRIAVDKGILGEFRSKQVDSESLPSSASELCPDLGQREGLDTSTLMDEAYEYVPPCKDDSSIFQEDIEEGTLSAIYNYFNILEHKYSFNRPEVSYDGSYVGDNRWHFERENKRITGTVGGSILRNPLLFETYWHPVDFKELLTYVQSRATSVPKDQYLSLCLVNSGWSHETKEWVRKFIHPRLTLFLYSLDEDKLVFNETSGASKKLYEWHSSDRKMKNLEEKLHELLENQENFSAEELSNATGLSSRGAECFLQKLVKNRVVIDLGFGSSMYAKPKTP